MPTHGPPVPRVFTNLLYQFDPDTGKAISAPQADRTGNARMQAPARRLWNAVNWTRTPAADLAA